MKTYTEEQIVRSLIEAARDGGVAWVDLRTIGGLHYRVVIADKKIRLEMASCSVDGSATVSYPDKPGIDGYPVKELIEKARAGMARECRLIMEA